MSDAVQIQLIIALFGFLGLIAQGFIAYYVGEMRRQATAAAVAVKEVKEVAKVAAGKVDEVKTALEETTTTSDRKLDSLAKVAHATHTLVNSAMSNQLKISAVALRRVAEMTQNPDDIAAADLAEKGLREHQSKQALVDDQPGTDDEKKGKSGASRGPVVVPRPPIG